MARRDGAQPRDRPDPARPRAGAQDGAPGAIAGGSRRGGGRGGLDDPGRAARADLRLLPPCARGRGAGRAGSELVVLEEQDRGLWDTAEIEEGRRLLDTAFARRGVGPYQVQAAIAALHAAPETDWREIACLYGVLAAQQPSPVVELNRAVAVAFADGLEQGLELLERIDGLEGYHLFHSARADPLRRL